MEKVRIALYTPLPGFANDLCDVLKLFFQVEAFDVNPEGEGGEPLRHDYQERGGVARSVMHLRGRSFAMEQALPQAAPGGDGEHLAVALKRVRKRLCKLSLYRLLKELTGAHPPWGALTGIRPTRLLCQAMEEGRSMEEAERYLESFFDVTPEKAALLARIVREQQKLPAPCTAQADVYISIPFCRTRCAYCSFPGEAVGKGGRIAPYLEALFGEMREGARLMERCGLSLRALYVGGGTPSALGEEDFARLMDEVMARFPGAREYTVEAGRPDTITRGKLLALKRLGIGRISINPQTMNDETLRLIGRDHTARRTCEAFALARELGFDDINMDVIAGLPGEDEAAFARTMEAVRRLAPDSLTVWPSSGPAGSIWSARPCRTPPWPPPWCAWARRRPRRSALRPITSTGRSTWPDSSRTWATPAPARRACTMWISWRKPPPSSPWARGPSASACCRTGSCASAARPT